MDKATKCSRRFALDWILVMAFVLVCAGLSLVISGALSGFFSLLWKVFLVCYAIGRSWWAIGVLRTEEEAPAADPEPEAKKSGRVFVWIISFALACFVVYIIVSFSGHFKQAPVRLAKSQADGFDALIAEGVQGKESKDNQKAVGGATEELFIVNAVD